MRVRGRIVGGLVMMPLVVLAACVGDNPAISTPDGVDGSPEGSTTPPPPPPPPGTDGGSDGAITDAPADVIDSGPARPGCNGAINCERTIFVTPDQVASPTGLAGGDAICQSYADAATLPSVKQKKFVAWLSASGTGNAAKDRLVHGSQGYRLVDTTLIANNWSDLTDGTLAKAIVLDSTGGAISASYVWTGTTIDGSLGIANCGDWGGTGQTVVGSLVETGSAWTSYTTGQGCSLMGRLYCFEY